MEFWDTVDELRDKQGVTQVDFCKKIGISAATYANYRSKNASPTLRQIENVSKILEIDLLETMVCSKFKQSEPRKEESESEAVRRLTAVFDRVLTSKELEIDRLVKHQSWLEGHIDGLTGRLAPAKQ